MLRLGILIRNIIRKIISHTSYKLSKSYTTSENYSWFRPGVFNYIWSGAKSIENRNGGGP